MPLVVSVGWLFNLFDVIAGAGQDSCLTCAPAHLYVIDLAVCLQICPDGYFESKYTNKYIKNHTHGISLIISSIDYDNKTCVPCESNCASCQDKPDYCMSCEHHLVMYNHKCYSSCPQGTYETEDYRWAFMVTKLFWKTLNFKHIPSCAECHSTCRYICLPLLVSVG